MRVQELLNLYAFHLYFLHFSIPYLTLLSLIEVSHVSLHNFSLCVYIQLFHLEYSWIGSVIKLLSISIC